jgi:hypothetical protein
MQRRLTKRSREESAYYLEEADLSPVCSQLLDRGCAELQRMLSRRSSQNSPSTLSGE